ncbi:hypothetical protein FSP39_008543 [Pinctada imbricata]|uniref:rRNA-processing protein EBP2 n=1 Tax=Pinctada imbricata TaxID=66713 RepID=A0AA88Y5S3_PINIB|nr:hypothetical protein FSP39_008543 [Pinctada imbricata]
MNNLATDGKILFGREESSAEETELFRYLQEAFAAGRLKPGLSVELPAKSQVNNVAGMKQKLKEFQNNLEWIERLDLTNAPAPAAPGMELEGEDDVHNDFTRELRFYRQAQASVLEGIPRLQALDIQTKRPEDYFAEMAKSDDHMKRVREKLLEKQMSIDRREKVRKQRDLRKYGKKVQQEVLLKRQKEKKEMLESVKRYRKGQQDKIDFLNDLDDKSEKPRNKQQRDNKKNRINKKREFKNKKFGFGGQKKRSKMNTASSAGDMSDFNPRLHQKKAGKPKAKMANKRPGKSKRMKNKNKKR